MISRVVALVFVFGIALAVACSVNVDIANKACASNGACGAGYVCDNKVCVLPQDVKGAGSSGTSGTSGTSGNNPVPACDPCPCPTGQDTECKAPRPRCSPTTKTCVDCLPAADNCLTGFYCNAFNQCTVGCKVEGDCTGKGLHCDLSRHQCVECIEPAYTCSGTKKCSPSGICVEACTSTCVNTAETCCNGLCLNLKIDVLNCGACGTRCKELNGTPKCTAGACDWDCAAGFTHCDGTNNTGCESNTGTDATRCGSCTKSCAPLSTNAAGVTCANSTCGYTTCNAGFVDADNDRTNGCEKPCGKENQACCPGNVCQTTGGCNNGLQTCKGQNEQ